MVDTSGLSDNLQNTLIGRLDQTRNPNVSTDAGTNSTSPYFLGATPTSSARTISQLGQQWSNTASYTSAVDADTRARQQQAIAQKAAQNAAAQLQKLTDQIQTGALAADAANQKRLSDLQRQAGQYVTNQDQQWLNSLSGSYAAGAARGRSLYAPAGGSYQGSTFVGSTGAGIDAQSRAAYNHAMANGYAGRFSIGQYSKSYTYDPSIDAARNKAMALATSYAGTPYVLGGTSHNGIDCSGLVMAVYNQLGYNINQHHATWQRDNVPGTRVAWGSSLLKPGDLIAWRDGSHIAVYAGHGQIIEAGNTREGTVRRALWANPSDVVGIHLNI